MKKSSRKKPVTKKPFRKKPVKNWLIYQMIQKIVTFQPRLSCPQLKMTRKTRHAQMMTLTLTLAIQSHAKAKRAKRAEKEEREERDQRKAVKVTAAAPLRILEQRAC